jgi:hypothetical protein
MNGSPLAKEKTAQPVFVQPVLKKRILLLDYVIMFPHGLP